MSDDMKLPTLVGLYSSAPQMGKSTVANVLVNEYGYRALKFAAPLKDMVRALLADLLNKDVIERCIEGDLKETDLLVVGIPGLTARRLMQTLGTEWGRNTISPELWVQLTLARIRPVTASGGRVVIDDMRFPNEYRAIQALGGKLVRVHRPSRAAESTHASEGSLNDYAFDYTINSPDGIENVQSDARRMMEAFTKEPA